MKLHHHTAVSLIISGLLYLIFKSWGMAFASLIAGIFIDLDHIIDYLREYGWPLKIKKFFYVCEENQLNHTILLFHAWEWLALFCALSWFSNWNPWITGTFIGLTHHMVMDELWNKSNFRGYSLFWRWKNNFNHAASFPYNNKGILWKKLRGL